MTEEADRTTDHRDDQVDASLDLVTLAVVTGLGIGDWLRDRLRAEGYDGLRFSQIFVFTLLARGPVTVRQLADTMGFSHQAASQLADELAGLGLLRRVPNPADGRSKLLELTDSGIDVLRVAAEARDEVLATLTATHGAEHLAVATAVVEQLFGLVGGTDAIRLRDLRLPRNQ